MIVLPKESARGVFSVHTRQQEGLELVASRDYAVYAIEVAGGGETCYYLLPGADARLPIAVSDQEVEIVNSEIPSDWVVAGAEEPFTSRITTFEHWARDRWFLERLSDNDPDSVREFRRQRALQADLTEAEAAEALEVWRIDDGEDSMLRYALPTLSEVAYGFSRRWLDAASVRTLASCRVAAGVSGRIDEELASSYSYDSGAVGELLARVAVGPVAARRYWAFMFSSVPNSYVNQATDPTGLASEYMKRGGRQTLS